MSKLQAIRAALLVILAAALLTLNLCVAYGMPARAAVMDEFRLLAMLHGELALVLLGVMLWPRQRWWRMALGGFMIALVWLAEARIAADVFLFNATLATLLMVAFVMVTSFVLPCATAFELFRRWSKTRLMLFQHRDAAPGGAQFGIRHLLLLTTGCAIVALAGRSLVPASMVGQSSLELDPHHLAVLSMLCLFPGLAAGPLALAVMRPSWRALWVAPWLLLLGVTELYMVAWVDLVALTAQTWPDVFDMAIQLGTGYVELAVVIIATFGLARLGGLRLGTLELSLEL